MCNNPAPMFGGKQCKGDRIENDDCIGSAEDDYEEFCYKDEIVENSFSLPVKLIYAIEKNLKSLNRNYEISENDNLEIKCGLSIKNKIDKYFNSSMPRGVEVEWVFNGDSIQNHINKLITFVFV